jgi:hypothetical protein
MTVATAEQHLSISNQFLEHADDEFRRGDLLQASEKAWGAVSHYVNSIARQRGWPMGSHKRMIENAREIFKWDQKNAAHYGRLLRSVEGLHANFYQAEMDEDSVREGIEDAKELVSAMAGLNANA